MKRVASALVGLPLVVAAVFMAGTGLFRVIVLILFLLALWEYLRLCGVEGFLFAVTLTAGGLAVGMVSPATNPAFPGLALLLLIAASLWRMEDPRKRFRSLAESALGMAYLAYAFICLLLLHDLPLGSSWTMIVIGTIWSGDTAAYYGGRRFGGPRMAPLLSPKKTWSGAVSGLLGSVTGAVALALILPGTFPLGKVAAIALFVGVSGQAGDLAESLWKRAKGVKDSGRLIPGHGGLLDRIDGLLMGLPVGYNLIRLLVP